MKTYMKREKRFRIPRSNYLEEIFSCQGKLPEDYIIVLTAARSSK